MMVIAAGHATDTPVWALFGATLFLGIITFVLSAAALYGLGQVQTAVRQLEEVKRDRHLQVLGDFGIRWDSGPVWEARQKLMEVPNSDDLAELVGEWYATRDPSAKDVQLYLRVPNFFEDLALMMEAGQLDYEWFRRNMRSVALDTWKYWEPAVTKMRERRPSSYIEFEGLVKRLR
jgi:hypothetical protein